MWARLWRMSLVLIFVSSCGLFVFFFFRLGRLRRSWSLSSSSSLFLSCSLESACGLAGECLVSGVQG
jgi:hypothetical protein